MDEAKLKSSKYWKTQKIEDTFNIKQLEESRALNEWLDVNQ